MLTTTLLALSLFVQDAPLKKSTKENPPPPPSESTTAGETPEKAELKPADGKCCTKGKAEPWDGYNKGVEWEKDEKYAWELAKADRRIVMYFQLVGDLDKEGC